MGYLTTFMVMNDAHSTIQDNPKEFTNKILDAMTTSYGRHIGNSVSLSVGNHANPVKVFTSQHADVPQMLIAYQNDFVRLGYSSDLTESRHLEYRKHMLDMAKRIIEDEERLIEKMEKEQLGGN